MEHTVAQAVGGCAFVVGLSAFWQRDDRRFSYQMVLFCAVMAVHFSPHGRACCDSRSDIQWLT